MKSSMRLSLEYVIMYTKEALLELISFGRFGWAALTAMFTQTNLKAFFPRTAMGAFLSSFVIRKQSRMRTEYQTNNAFSWCKTLRIFSRLWSGCQQSPQESNCTLHQIAADVPLYVRASTARVVIQAILN